MALNNFKNTLAAVLVFSIAMGFLEAAVVIYLRDLYYPEGFGFPLVPISKLHGIVELIREAATIVMLAALGWLAGTNFVRSFAFFLLSFGIWDLMYYLALKLVLNWPDSFLEWDVLFLIPIPWFGPVIAPCLLSLMMLLLAVILLRAPETISSRQVIGKLSWILLIAGSQIVIVSFVIDYLRYVFEVFNVSELPVNDELLFMELAKFVPVHFNWLLFGTGCMVISAGIFNIYSAITRLTRLPGYRRIDPVTSAN